MTQTPVVEGLTSNPVVFSVAFRRNSRETNLPPRGGLGGWFVAQNRARRNEVEKRRECDREAPASPEVPRSQKDGPDLSVKTLGREWMWSPAGDLDAAQQKSGMDYS
jgi:hypothetical protein